MQFASVDVIDTLHFLEYIVEQFFYSLFNSLVPLDYLLQTLKLSLVDIILIIIYLFILCAFLTASDSGV